jgi:hypothetical protein
VKRYFKTFRKVLTTSMLLTAAGLPTYGSAAPPNGNEESAFSLSGFGTFALGKVLSGTQDASVNQGYDCPCFISDYAQNGVYEGNRLQFKPDSKLGVQGQWSSANKQYAITGQLVSRGAANGAVNAEWLYGTAEINHALTLQVGRKRIPLLQYSDVQDVGHAIPWIHLPPQIYGWENVNYNGANLRYTEQLGSWFLNANAFAGSESQKDSGYWKVYNGKSSRTASKWSNIAGLEVKASKGWFDVRGVYLQSNTQNRIVSLSAPYSDPKKQKIYGLSLNADFGKPFIAADFLLIDRREDYGGDRAQLYSAGYRYNKFTPFISFSNYQQLTNSPALIAEAHRTISAVLRYDVTTTSALKAQFDFWQDRSAPGFTSQHGNSKLLSVSYDRVF